MWVGATCWRFGHKGKVEIFLIFVCADGGFLIVKPLQIHWRRQSWTTFRKLSHLKRLTRRNFRLFPSSLPPLPLQLLFTTATIYTSSLRLRQSSRTHHHASGRLWEAHLPPSGMTLTFVGRLITLRLTPTLIFTQSTGYEKNWRYRYKAGEVKGLMCENVPAIDTLTVIVRWPIRGIRA